MTKRSFSSLGFLLTSQLRPSLGHATVFTRIIFKLRVGENTWFRMFWKEFFEFFSFWGPMPTTCSHLLRSDSQIRWTFKYASVLLSFHPHKFAVRLAFPYRPLGGFLIQMTSLAPHTRLRLLLLHSHWDHPEYDQQRPMMEMGTRRSADCDTCEKAMQLSR